MKISKAQAAKLADIGNKQQALQTALQIQAQAVEAAVARAIKATEDRLGELQSDSKAIWGEIAKETGIDIKVSTWGFDPDTGEIVELARNFGPVGPS